MHEPKERAGVSRGGAKSQLLSRGAKALALAATVALLAFAAYALGLSDAISSPDALERMSRAVDDNFALAAFIYLVCTAVCCSALALPGVAFALVAGVAFGPVAGTLLCSAATTVGAMASFLLGRYFLKDAVEPLVRRNALLSRWLLDEGGMRAVALLAVTRLVPIFPYNLQNFAYGITNIRFGTYSLFSWAFMLPGTALYTFAAAGVIDGRHRVLYLGVSAALLLVVLGAALLVRRRFNVQATGLGKGIQDEDVIERQDSSSQGSGSSFIESRKKGKRGDAS